MYRNICIVDCNALEIFNCYGLCLCFPLQRLNALKPVRKNVKCAALEPKNVTKNRVIEIIPGKCVAFLIMIVI